MTFHHRIQSRIEGITVVEDLRWRAWPGLVADIWHVAGETGAGDEYLSPHHRLFVVSNGGEAGRSALRAPPRRRTATIRSRASTSRMTPTSTRS